jgi:hypothetical protein
MEQRDLKYFQKMSNYKPRGIKNINYIEIIDNIGYTSLKIRSTAKDALSELLSPKIARKEISDLLDSIKQLKKDDKS